jgi:hypothetical protein
MHETLKKHNEIYSNKEYLREHLEKAQKLPPNEILKKLSLSLAKRVSFIENKT